MANQEKYSPVYFKSLTLENVKCFKGQQFLDLSENGERPAQWTVILGNNGTGKTTLLKHLTNLEPEKVEIDINGERKNLYRPNNYLEIEERRNIHSFSINHNFFVSGNLIESIKAFKSFDGMPLFVGEQEKFSIKNSKLLWGKEKDFDLKIYAYGASRQPKKTESLESEREFGRHDSLFEDRPLPKADEWLARLDHQALKGNGKATEKFEKVKKVLISLLPDVEDLRVQVETGLFLECKTEFGWVPFRELSHGYLSMAAWVVDLVKRLFERYPESENPLAEPAVVLVDEIDLHLHPEWQRKIIGFLSDNFPNTQFIVTAHSPLIVQSAEKINLVLLQKEGNGVQIQNKVNVTYKGWSVNEILTDLMNIKAAYSDTYVRLMAEFEVALEAENGDKATEIYQQLEKILHPHNSMSKILRLDLASIGKKMPA